MILWYPIEIERALSAGIRYREQLRREALAREARGELPRSVLPLPLAHRRLEPPPPPDPEQMRWPEGVSEEELGEMVARVRALDKGEELGESC